MPKVYVSPSDQSANAYAVGNTTEKVQCQKISTDLVAALKRCKIDAKDNHTGNMGARVAESNAFGADLHLPIHTNAFNTKVQGTRIFVYDLAGNGYKAAQCIMKHLAPITPGSSDGITEQKDLYEIKNADAPTVYIEVAFHDNQEEAKWIIEHTTEIAEAICKGICEYYDIAYVAPGDTGSELFRVQVGAFRNKANADAFLAELKSKGYTDAFIVKR